MGNENEPFNPLQCHFIYDTLLGLHLFRLQSFKHDYMHILCAFLLQKKKTLLIKPREWDNQTDTGQL